VLVGMVSRTDVVRSLTHEAPDFASRGGSGE
jgi:hypothetical protein